mgnify:CR=1 FL=1
MSGHGSSGVTVGFAPEMSVLSRVQGIRATGRVAGLRGMTVLVEDLPLPVGTLVSIGRAGDGADAARTEPALGEIVGFTRTQAQVMMLGRMEGIRPGDAAVGEQVAPTIGAGPSLVGRVIDGLGRPIDGKGRPEGLSPRLLAPEPLGALTRRRVTERIETGVRAIDLMLTMGKGQRMGVFAGPGVGKSTLVGTIAKRTSADVSVIALIGERGREVKDFVEHVLGEEGLARAVVVVATGDEGPLMRVRAAMAAMSVAEDFRDRGMDVLLIMDSVTRFAHAQRQIGLSVGEPPATRGYTPSVFSALAQLLERAGAVDLPGGGSGSVTGLFSVLVEGDDMTEPVADAARGILDGHVWLSRKLAQRGHYPAIDVLDSISRVADDVTDKGHQSARRQIQRLVSMYREVEELVRIGAYASGSSPETDVAIEVMAKIDAMLRQGRDDRVTFEEARSELLKIAIVSGDMVQKRAAAKSRA